MRLNYLFLPMCFFMILYCACDGGLPKTDEVDIAPYNAITGLTLPIQSQKKDNFLYILDKKAGIFCLNLNDYISLANSNLGNQGNSGTLSSNSSKISKAITAEERVILNKLPENTIRPAGINLSTLSYSLNPIDFSLTSDGSNLYILVSVSCDDNSDIDGMYYILRMETASKTLSCVTPLDRRASYRKNDGEKDVTLENVTASTGNVARRIYAGENKLFLSGSKRLFVIPLVNGNISPDYDFYTNSSKCFLSAETSETSNPYLIQVCNDNIYLSSRETGQYGIHVYSYSLNENKVTYLRKEENASLNTNGEHFPISMHIYNNQLLCSSYKKFGVFNVELETVNKVMMPTVSNDVLVMDIKKIENNYVVGYNYKITEDMTLENGYEHCFIRSGVALYNETGNRLTSEDNFWIDGNIRTLELWQNGDNYFSIALCQDKSYLIINQLK